MFLAVNYGLTEKKAFLGEKNLLGILDALPSIGGDMDEGNVIREALRSPIGSKRLSQIVGHEERVVIVTSDNTRPMPSRLVLPYVLEELFSAGIKRENILVLIGLGSHREMTVAEIRELVGDEVYNSVRCENPGPDYSYIGTTSRGNRIELSKKFVQADRRICLGNIEYHYFAGFSGGMKAVMPGVASYESIRANHSLMLAPSARAGLLKGNPVREDIDEVRTLIPVDFILNVILSDQRKVVAAVAGDALLAHQEGCRRLTQLNLIYIYEQADIVIASAGGFPKDINFYQAQKALDNAWRAVKKGGTIILVAECREGTGSQVFEDWLMKSASAADLFSRLEENFILGGHKAAAVAKVLANANVVLVSSLDPQLVESLHMHPSESIEEAYKYAAKFNVGEPTVYIMPHASNTFVEMRLD